jgi:hypothetical protein
MTERSRTGVLDEAIDEGLRRHFQPPANLESRFTVGDSGPSRGAAARRWPYLALALTAAAAVLLLWSRPDGERASGRARSTGDSGSRVARAVAESGPGAWPAIGPLQDPAGGPLENRPDLGRLYRTMAAAHRSATVSACDEGDRLDERLEQTYGPGARLGPGAAGRLHGPFASPEWPTGTILTGSIGDQTSVLIAESDEALVCCTDIRVPEDSGLRVFTWRVGNVALTEVTPLGEPHLIEECFQ